MVSPAVVAQNGDTTYLLDVGDGNGRIFEYDERRLLPALPLALFFGRGYWDAVTSLPSDFAAVLATATEPTQKFNPYHRGPGPGGGQFTSADDVGGEVDVASEDRVWSQMHGGFRKVETAEQAVRALAKGELVELPAHQVGPMLDRLALVAQRAERLGTQAPNYDLCNVMVEGSSIFCIESQGIPRVKMPQIASSEKFREYLKERYVSFKDDVARDDELKPTQNQLNGANVAGQIRAYEQGKFDLRGRSIFVSRDNYVLDGHHTWAATVGLDYKPDAKPGDLTMKVTRVDLPITALLTIASDYARREGTPTKGFGVMGKAIADAYDVLAKFNEHHDPDTGRFTFADGGGLSEDKPPPKIRIMPNDELDKNKNFIDEIQSKGVASPLADANLRVHQMPGGGMAQLTLSEFEGAVWIDWIGATRPGTRAGSELMQQIVDLADKRGVLLRLQAVPLGSLQQSEAKLIRFYEKFGFESDEIDPTEMTRVPKREAAKFNPYHNAENGQFDFAPGGGAFDPNDPRYDPGSPQFEAGAFGALPVEQARMVFAVRDAKMREVMTAYSLGEITKEEAVERGAYSGDLDRMEPLPPTLYHVTTAMDAVLDTGLETKEARADRELMVGNPAPDLSSGLGGGPRNMVSMTDSLGRAQGIERTLLEGHDAVTGALSVDDMLSQARAGTDADHPYDSDTFKYFKAAYGGSDELNRARLAGEIHISGPTMKGFLEHEMPKDARMSESDYMWTDGNGEKRYSGYYRPMTDAEKTDTRFELYRAFALARQHAGGPEYGYFGFNNAEALGKVDRKQIGIVEATSKPGALGVYASRVEDEWRVYTGKVFSSVRRVRGAT